MAINSRLLTESGADQTDLSRTWFFRISSLAFISLTTPMLSVPIRGLVGFWLLIGVAVIAGLAENSFSIVSRRVRQGFAANRLLVIFVLWYFVGLVLNLFTRGGGVDDWRLMLSPLVLLAAMGFAFGFCAETISRRTFQVWFLLIAGVQAIIAIGELSSEAGIAREMWIETQGVWIYGNQSVYATLTLLLPVLIWRAISETKVLRLLLLAAVVLVFVEVAISSFATPLGLLILGIPFIIGMAIVFPVGRGRKVAMLVAIVMGVGGWVGYQLTYDSPFLTPAYSRLENVLLDPESGGYVGATRESSRWYLAEISLRSFEAEPLFGMGGGSTRYSEFVGGHSSFLDSLGSYGLLGGGGALVGVILILLATAVRRFFKERSWETLLALTSVMLLVVGGIINPYWEGWQPAFVVIMIRMRSVGALSASRTPAQNAASPVSPIQHSRFTQP